MYATTARKQMNLMHPVLFLYLALALVHSVALLIPCAMKHDYGVNGVHMNLDAHVIMLTLLYHAFRC